MANCIRCGRQLPPLTFKKICQWCVQHEAAQRGEELDDTPQPVITRPWVRRSESSITLTQVIFGANIAVFLATALASGSAMNISGEVSVHFGANFGPYTLSGEWWRLLTYMFLHGGAMHIFFNMWCLWDLGRLCESLYGRWTFAAIYLITGVAGGLASVAWNPRVLSVGASGAIFGLAGALAASFYLGEFSLPSIAVRSTFRSLAVFIGFNVLFGFGYNVFLGGNSGIDNAAHIGGLVIGAILGALIARLAPQHDAPLRRATVVGVVALALLAAVFGVRQWRGGPMRLARQYQALQEKGDAVGRFQFIAKQQPKSVPAHLALAEAYFNKQQFVQAEAEYKLVLELDPANIPAKFNLGFTYLNEKKLDEAKAQFTDLLAQESTNAQAHYGLGLVMMEQKQYQAAVDEFKAALSKAPSMTDVYSEMGNAYAKLNRYDDAIAAYLKEKEKTGENPDLENALADAYQAKGMLKEAQDARDRAQQMHGPAAH
jgi:rhomboid protease GluP